MVEIVTCIPCQFGQHDEHQPVVEAAAPGVMGGAECHCKGECRGSAAQPPEGEQRTPAEPESQGSSERANKIVCPEHGRWVYLRYTPQGEQHRSCPECAWDVMPEPPDHTGAPWTVYVCPEHIQIVDSSPTLRSEPIMCEDHQVPRSSLDALTAERYERFNDAIRSMRDNNESLVDEIDNAWFAITGSEDETGDVAAAAKRLRIRAESAESSLSDTKALLRELLRWQPSTEVGLDALHPQHRNAVEAARKALDTDPSIEEPSND